MDLAVDRMHCTALCSSAEALVEEPSEVMRIHDHEAFQLQSLLKSYELDEIAVAEEH